MMETEVENGKPKEKKRATRKRKPIDLTSAPVCCDLYTVKSFDIDAQKLVEEAVVLSSENEEENKAISTSRKGQRSTLERRSENLAMTSDSVVIDSDEELNSSQQSRGSPSPPTPPPELKNTQQRPSRQLSRVMQNVGQAVHEKLRTLQEWSPTPVSPVILIDDSVSPKKKRTAIVVKIRSKSGLHRTVLQMEENFENVFDDLAEKEGVNANQIMLSRGEQIIKLTDTPLSLNLQLAHILDCVIVESINNNSIIEQVEQEDMLNVKVQGTGKSSSTTISIAKTSNFHKLLQKYSDFIGIAETKIKFTFDGDPVDIKCTPIDLEMEDDDVLDAIIN